MVGEPAFRKGTGRRQRNTANTLLLVVVREIGYPGVMQSILLRLAAVITASLNLGLVPSWAEDRVIPPAFGPYVNLTTNDFAGSHTFSSQDKVVGTYYFYWYDVDSKSHVVDGDGTDALTTHPPTLEDFSYKSVRWHRKQLLDMEAAGIDMALMVFWGSPAEHPTNTDLHWSFAGLPPLVQAREELLRAGHRPPHLGLFYDTSTLQHNHWHYHADLTTDFGKQFFYGTVRDFYSCVPPRHWAMIDGQPVVLLYAAAFAKKWDQGFIDYTRQHFAKEFGGRRPWLAPQDSWNVKADGVCAWGGALGYRNPGIGEIGPGYDHSAVPGRTPLVREREGGKFYEDSWLKFLRRPTHLVMIETWNEFHEGTDIAESREYGRQYIELTRQFVDRFKRGWKPPRPTGKFSGRPVVSVELAEPNREQGLRQIECEDGGTSVVTKGGVAARRVKPFRNSSRYLYCAADDSFKWSDEMDLTLEVRYFDAAKGELFVEFDGGDTNAPFGGAYTRSASTISLVGDSQWKTGRFRLSGARLLNAQNGGADFRLVGNTAELIVSELRLERTTE